MNSDKGFWTFIERFKLVIEIVVTLTVIAPVVLAGANLITTGLSAVVPAWSVLVAAIAALALGYLVARRPKVVLGTQKKFIIRREFYSVVWEIDQVSGQVDGPFCKTCYVRMIPEYYDDRYGRGSVTDLVFVCRNPECKNHVAIARGLDNVANVEQARHRVHEQIQAEKRGEDVAKLSKS